jgi:hypothetical protein
MTALNVSLELLVTHVVCLVPTDQTRFTSNGEFNGLVTKRSKIHLGKVTGHSTGQDIHLLLWKVKVNFLCAQETTTGPYPEQN